MASSSWRAFLVSVLLASAASAVLAENRYIIAGIQGPALDNVSAFLPAMPHADDVNNVQYQRRVLERTTQALQAIGYYHPDIDIATEQDNADWLLVVTVTLGRPTLVATMDWSITGAGEHEEALLNPFSKSPLTPGAPLHHEQYETLKSDVQTTALSLGYLDSRFEQSQVLVNTDTDRAAVVLHFVTGDRYYFGEVAYSDTAFDSDLVTRISAISTGDIFSTTQINQLYQDLVNSRYFQSVSIQPDLEARSQNQVPVTVELSPRERNVVTMGVGASTNMGPRLKVGWEKPWINGAGHRVQSGIEYSDVLRKVTAGYQIPLENPLNEFVAVQTGWQREYFEDIVIDKQSLSLEKQIIVGNGWTQTLFMRWDKEKSRVNDDIQVSNLYVPGITLSKVFTTGDQPNDWTLNQSYSVEVSHELWGSDVSLTRFRAQISGTRALRPKHYVQLRTAFGTVLGAEADDTPASMRFYTGGDQTIRGFAYNSIGAADAAGDVVGGQNLIVGGVEYAYAYLPNWRAALFMDAGNAFNDATPVKIGVGPGIHWLTPIGTLRFELGYGISEPTPPIRLHLSFGMQL